MLYLPFQVKAFIATELLAHLYSGDQVICLLTFIFNGHQYIRAVQSTILSAVCHRLVLLTCITNHNTVFNASSKYIKQTGTYTKLN